MSEEISARKVTKFNDENFQGWKFQVNSLFFACGIQDVVTSTRVLPQDVVSTEAKTWVHKIHRQKSVRNKLMLMQKFFSYQMSASDSVVTHITKIQNLASQIADVGEKLSEVTIIAKILKDSLTLKYSAFQTMWDSVESERQTIANLQERLLKEEAIKCGK
ncbi:hypothetical protein ACFW04_008302 [Cataglyphis niger]